MSTQYSDEPNAAVSCLAIIVVVVMGFILFKICEGFISQHNDWLELNAERDLAACRKLFGEEYNLNYGLFTSCTNGNETKLLPDYY